MVRLNRLKTQHYENKFLCIQKHTIYVHGLNFVLVGKNRSFDAKLITEVLLSYLEKSDTIKLVTVILSN